MAVNATSPARPDAVEGRILDLLVAGVPAATILAELVRAEPRAPEVEAAVRRFAALLRLSAQRREASGDHAVWIASVRRTLGAMQPLARVRSIAGAAFYRDHYREHRPLLVDDADAGGTAFRWTFPAIRAELGDERVEVMRRRSAGTPDFLDPRGHASEVTLRDFVDEIHSVVTNEVYLTAYNHALRGPLGRVVRDYRPMPEVVDYERFDASLWMGPEGAISHLHYDKTNVLLVQLLGTKRVTLIGPHDECFLAHDDETLTSPVDPHDLAAGAAPFARYARPSSVLVPAGSALFIPVGWWHHVESLTPSLSISISSFHAPNVFPAALF